MTTKEQQTIDQLFQTVSSLREENRIFKQSISELVDKMNSKVDAKHLPLSLEQNILATMNQAMSKSISDALGGYSSPLNKYAINVVERYENQIKSVFDSIVSESIQTEDFKDSIREVLLNKITKTMIAGVDGSVDKVVVQMKNDPVFRSKLTLFVNNLADEFLGKKSA